MFEALKKLKYKARVLLSRRGSEPEMIDVAGRPTEIRSGGSGPPFVYLHSTLGESMRWLPFHDAWARHFTVYSPMHPGFGNSGGLEDVERIEDMAFHYLELFDTLGLNEIVLGGVSLGGWIAAEFAVRWPERVKCLWLSGAPGLWVEKEPLPDLFRTLNHPDRVRELLFNDPKGHMADLVLGGEMDDERRITSYKHLSVLARLTWERPYDPRLQARLYRVQVPTLLVWGANDRLVPPAYGRAYQKHLPQAEWHEIANSGHVVMFEKEAEFVDAVMKFARRV